MARRDGLQRRLRPGSSSASPSAPDYRYGSHPRGIEQTLARTAPVVPRSLNPSQLSADDAFFSDLEVALERPHTRELIAFDALTPHVREVTTR